MKFLTVSQAIKIHGIIIDELGGANGLRSRELLESAVFRMRTSFEGRDLYKTIFEKAATILESIAKNHPFIDGNKRTAFVCSVTFLEVNGYKTAFDAEKAEDFMTKVANREKSLVEISNFLKENLI